MSKSFILEDGGSSKQLKELNFAYARTSTAFFKAGLKAVLPLALSLSTKFSSFFRLSAEFLVSPYSLTTAWLKDTMASRSASRTNLMMYLMAILRRSSLDDMCFPLLVHAPADVQHRDQVYGGALLRRHHLGRLHRHQHLEVVLPLVPCDRRPDRGGAHSHLLPVNSRLRRCLH